MGEERAGWLEFASHHSIPYGCWLVVAKEPVEIGARWVAEVASASHKETVALSGIVHSGESIVVLRRNSTPGGQFLYGAVSSGTLERKTREIEVGLGDLLGQRTTAVEEKTRTDSSGS